jgi:hypothetical protein
VNRRDFLVRSAATGGVLAFTPGPGPSTGRADTLCESEFTPAPAKEASGPKLPDLSPARWLWYPSERCLANTFVLFRREVALTAPPRRAAGWIAADSRYLLEINGARVQWGPPPSDPRWPEADPIDLTAHLRAGPNVIGATVLYYGHGDGTWPIGKPGFLFWLELVHADGRAEQLVSNAAWVADRPRPNFGPGASPSCANLPSR